MVLINFTDSLAKQGKNGITAITEVSSWDPSLKSDINNLKTFISMIYSNDSFTKLFSTSAGIRQHTEIAESVPCRSAVTNVITYSVSLFTLTFIYV